MVSVPRVINTNSTGRAKYGMEEDSGSKSIGEVCRLKDSNLRRAYVAGTRMLQK